MDLLDTEADLQQVLAFVAEHARDAIGSDPDTFPVSARLAMRAKQGQPDAWAASRFEALEHYIHDRLDQRERLRLKLANPVGIGTALASRYLEVTQGRLALLQDDLRLLDDVEKQHAIHREDMARQFELRMGEIDNVLLQMEQRGHVYFDDMLRIGRVVDLLNKARVQEGFVREVVAEAPVQIERKVSELIDWMVSTDLRQWQQVNNHLAERRRQYRDRIVGDPELATFHVERGRLLESVGREAQRVVDSFDRQREAASLAEGARNAVAAAAAAGAGALGLGTLVTIAASTAAADITGIVLAGVIATIGLFIVPARRRKAKEDLRQKVRDLRETLSRALRAQFQQEVQHSTERLNEGHRALQPLRACRAAVARDGARHARRRAGAPRRTQGANRRAELTAGQSPAATGRPGYTSPRRDRCAQTGRSARRLTRGSGRMSCPGTSRTRNSRQSIAAMIGTSSIENCDPTHCLGPAPNGKYANRCRPAS